MRYFPVFVDLEQAKLLIVGGGEQAAQKLRLALKTPALICVVAPSPCLEIEAAARRGRVRLERRGFRVSDLEGCRLAISATGDAAEAARVAAAARAAGVLLNAVDRPDLSSFLTPAIVDRDPVVVAIGTEGTGPVLARRIKAMLEALLPARLGALARWAGSLRGRVADALPDGPGRRRFWEQMFGGEVARAWLAGEP
ncbi:MAG TPA: bifunctional precorrin-2 dehydrogenase/sirohydrochlorin ferrochelatase, partial [Geminicoccaceae bacterium]|nr:bifunctional precorrin-2 dehydrogenase/sirohydrochlorin ferrochelatase [Geminicoccaceae bacterium]